MKLATLPATRNQFAAYGLLAAISAMLLLFAPEASAQIREGCEATGTCAGGQANLTNIIGTVVDILSIVVGALAVIMIIVGGLRYITSGGDSGNVSSAKNTILYAVVGLVIVVFAQVIVSFVINESTEDAGGGGGDGGDGGTPSGLVEQNLS